MDTSYLSQQVTTIIERLHGFFDEIGVPTHERDSRESEVRTNWSDHVSHTDKICSCSRLCQKHSINSSISSQKRSTTLLRRRSA